MKVIAISGWKRSGKDTIAARLVEDHGFYKVSFADPLKDMVAEQYDIPRLYCDEQGYKEKALDQYPVLPKDGYSLHISKYMIGEFRTLAGEKPLDYYVDPSGAFLGVLGRSAAQLYWTPRALCILEGSIKRTVNSSYWVEQTINNIEDEMHPTVQKVPESKDLFVIPDLRYKSEMQQLRDAFGKNLVTIRVNRFDTNPSADPSENDLNDGKFDYTIENTGTLEELNHKLTEIIKGLK